MQTEGGDSLGGHPAIKFIRQHGCIIKYSAILKGEASEAAASVSFPKEDQEEEET